LLLVLENNNARHALKHHADARIEAYRGQLPLDLDDLVAEIRPASRQIAFKTMMKRLRKYEKEP